MKRLVVTILSISVLGIIGGASASGAPTATQPPEASNLTLSAEVVNDIAVPLDVLLSVQTQYQGYAVTGANKVSRGGQQVYRLQVDRNNQANDGNSFYLLYDLGWKLIGEEKIAAPLQPAQPKRPEQPADKPKDEQKRPESQAENTSPAQPSAESENSTTQSQTNPGDTGTTDTTPPPTDTTTTDPQAPTTPTDGDTTNN